MVLWGGPLAGFGVAIDYDLITSGVGGWRDHAFTFAVVMFALTAVRFVRRPSGSSAVLLGVAGGIDGLVRITSLSFVLPVCAWLAIVADAPARVRLRRAHVGLCAPSSSHPP